MANANLNSLTFPGLSDTYKVNQIAAAFSTSTSYAVGDYCNYQGQIYRCTTAHSGAWNASNWTAVFVTDELQAEASVRENAINAALASIPFIDDTLSESGAAADAAAAGERLIVLESAVEDVEDALGAIEPSSNLLNPDGFTEGYYSSGTWTESAAYMVSDFMDVLDEPSVYIHMFNLNNGNLQDTVKTFNYIYWFDAQKQYLSRTSFTTGTTSYSVPSGAAFARVMDSKTNVTSRLANNKGFYVGVEDTTTWIAFDEGGIPNYSEIIAGINATIPRAALTLSGGEYTIQTNHAQYVVKRVTNADENLDTLRLYSGGLTKDGTTFTMWSNSDAEGAVKISGETDYVCGYHGSEVMTGYKIFMDGADITDINTFDDAVFNTLIFYVESDVYHCYQDTSVADQIAFKRAKIIAFEGDKVTVSNSYIAQAALTITTARIAVFQCYKTDGTNEVFTDFSVNSDFKNYAVADVATTCPQDSEDMTEAILNTIYGRIDFKSILTSGQRYKGTVTDLASQNRIKFYFDTISGSTNIAQGEQIKSQFEFKIS